MADRINVTGAASSLRSLNTDFTSLNRETTKMLDNLKYLQDNFYDIPDYACTDNYQKIAKSIYDSNGLIEVLRRVHKWCESVDAFVEEEERAIEEEKEREREERRAYLESLRNRSD